MKVARSIERELEFIRQSTQLGHASDRQPNRCLPLFDIKPSRASILSRTSVFGTKFTHNLIKANRQFSISLTWIDWGELDASIRADNELQQIVNQLCENPHGHHPYELLRQHNVSNDIPVEMQVEEEGFNPQDILELRRRHPGPDDFKALVEWRQSVGKPVHIKIGVLAKSSEDSARVRIRDDAQQ
ncbi:hypothetical protein DH2020_018393 [Rehmannia glutinosa]|uniref:Uncharacterized protein n=1 Tax=Rehmannia glutinosa TaxID=99300 RepID=A0ABR0WLJ1_REHGL